MVDWLLTINLWPEASRWMQSIRISCVMKSLASSRTFYVQPRKRILPKLQSSKKARNHSVWPWLKGTYDEVICGVLLLQHNRFGFLSLFYISKLSINVISSLSENYIQRSTSRSHSVIFKTQKEGFRPQLVPVTKLALTVFWRLKM